MLTFLALLACADDPKDTEVTWYRDVEPVVTAYCAGCHADGGVAPFPLTTYEDVYQWRSAIKPAIEAKTMPPWSADDCAEYNFDSSLSDDQISMLSGWIDAGAPEGDSEDIGQSITLEQQSLSRVDRSVTLDEPYPPDFDAGSDEYRCFVMDWPESEPTHISGFTLDPHDNPAIHHVIAYYAPPESADVYTALADEAEGPGYACYGGAGGDNSASWLGGWVPGGVGGDYPEGTGLAIDPGSVLILQIHLNAGSADGSPVNPTLQLKLDEEVESAAMVIPFTNPGWVDTAAMQIPSGEVTTHEFGYALPAAATVYSGAMHMHQLGSAGRLWLEHEDGSESCLFATDRYDFNWQRAYWLSEPATLEAGDSLNISCTWDNTTDEDITWGEGTADEMCLGFSYVVFG